MEISIIIPVYNRLNIFPRTLDSILAQTHKDIHLILVDNNSTDNSLTALKNYANAHKNIISKITILEEHRQGAAIARNTGAKAATSEWIMFFDSDDTMEDYLVSRYVEEIERQNDRIDIVGCRNDYIDLSGKRRHKPFRTNNIVINHILHTMLNTQRFIIRRDFFYANGTWDETLGAWDDFELGLRLILNAPRISWIKDCIPVHIYSQEKSLTGTHYSHSTEGHKLALSKCDKDIEVSSYHNKSLLHRYIDYKRLTLAALYTHEGCNEGKQIYIKLIEKYGNRYPERWLYPILYKYISYGGIGASHIAKRIIK